MDFKESFTQSIAAARSLASHRASIRHVLERFSSDIAEVSGNKLVIYFLRADSLNGVNLSDCLGDIVTNDGGMIGLFLCVAPVGADRGSERLAKVELSSVTGFPCFIDFDLDRYIVNNLDDLASTLKLMLDSSGVSQKLLNALSRAV